METDVTQARIKNNSESQNVDNVESVENFQTFVYELFEKNGILSDLRAYLRGHLVNVLRNAKKGNPPDCQKHYLQRLELNFQALNILIAEYLLRFEFSYTISVFVSEIPLANMVFGFAKSLMQRSDEDILDIRFTESDVWSILNYLGIPCDSVYASHVIQMYKSDKRSSLLLCILKSQTMYETKSSGLDKVLSSEETPSSLNTSESGDDKDCNISQKLHLRPEKCKHIGFCNTCQNHISSIKEIYRKKKKYLRKNVKININELNVKNLLKNIGVLERTLVNEMFHQLKSVYDTEVEMIKVEEEKKMKRSIASHAVQLQRQRDEMEQSFKAREAQLERDVAEKKKFLWGLARALRDQHRHMSRAMHEVQLETDRLSAKEESLKVQIAEAEELLQKRGEEMRSQISKELSILETHLNSMKNERENINKEKLQLENIKDIENSVIKLHNFNKEEINTQYNVLRKELDDLKKYFESSKLPPKCLIEKGMVTEISDVIILNNSHSTNRNKHEDIDDKLKNQVVNDFKKKNVNFSQSNLDEIYRDLSHTRDYSSGSSEVGDAVQTTGFLYQNEDTDIVRRLEQENSRLKECTKQQQVQIEALSRAATLLPCSCAAGAGTARAHVPARPRTAPLQSVVPVTSTAVSTPTSCQPFHFMRNMNMSVSANTVNAGWRKGAGEELSLFRETQPRILVPGDNIPFVGVMKERDRHTSRRQLMSQWRAFRSRTCPLVGVSKRTVSPLKEKHGSSSPTVIVSNPKASCSFQPDDVRPTHSMRDKTTHRPTSFDIKNSRDKSPKSVLREAKAKLRNIKETSISTREKSPNAIFREAKQRLRKLEIEAEVIEKSYRDFRQRQSELRLERNTAVLHDEPLEFQNIDHLDTKRSQSLQKVDIYSRDNIDSPLTDYQKTMRNDFDKYLREYQTKTDLKETYSRHQTVADMIYSIPAVYSDAKDINSTLHTDNYLETPLTEFRKLYQSNIKIADSQENIDNIPSKNSELSECGTVECDDSQPQSPRHDSRRHSKASELEILRQNINKMYNIPNNIESESVREETVTKVPDVEESNLLRIEVESTKTEKAQNISVVVQSAVINSHPVPRSLTSPNMPATIIVSPKNSGPHGKEKRVRSSSPEKDANLTRNDVLDAIYHADLNQKSSTVMNLELSKDLLESVSDYENEEDCDEKGAICDENEENYNEKAGNCDDNEYCDDKGEYCDDKGECCDDKGESCDDKGEYSDEKGEDYDDNLSGDADNYNSHIEPNSPISVVKTSDDENFWDQ